MQKKCKFCKKSYLSDSQEMSAYCSWECRAINEIAKNFERPEEKKYSKWIINEKIPIHKQPAWIKCVYKEFDDKRWKVIDHYGKKCKICGYDRVINTCHLIPKSLKGRMTNENIIILCPNHHWLLDHNLFNKEEKEKFIQIIEEEYENSRQILHFLDIKTYKLPIRGEYGSN